MFITLEGSDGSGKSTLLKRIEDDFKRRKIAHLTTREPGGHPVAEKIRDLLLHSGPIAPMTELLLYEAARAEHVESVIRPALKQGLLVLCDRFTHSTLAYQGYARKLGRELVESLNRTATGGLEPDAVIWLKIPVADARKRLNARGDENRLDREKEAFHQAVYEAFTEIAARESSRFIVLDATQSPDAVYEELTRHPLWKHVGSSA